MIIRPPKVKQALLSLHCKKGESHTLLLLTLVINQHKHIPWVSFLLVCLFLILSDPATGSLVLGQTGQPCLCIIGHASGWTAGSTQDLWSSECSKCTRTQWSTITQSANAKRCIWPSWCFRDFNHNTGWSHGPRSSMTATPMPDAKDVSGTDQH